MLWKIIEGLMPAKTLERVRFIKKGEESKMLEILNPDELEVRFGGNYPDISQGEFWPPRNYSKGPLCTYEYMSQNNISSFTILGEEDQN